MITVIGGLFMTPTAVSFYWFDGSSQNSHPVWNQTEVYFGYFISFKFRFLVFVLYLHDHNRFHYPLHCSSSRWWTQRNPERKRWMYKLSASEMWTNVMYGAMIKITFKMSSFSNQRRGCEVTNYLVDWKSAIYWRKDRHRSAGFVLAFFTLCSHHDKK